MSTGFSNLGNRLVGKYKVEIKVINNQFWQTKDIQKKLEEYGLEYGLFKENSTATIIHNYSF